MAATTETAGASADNTTDCSDPIADKTRSGDNPHNEESETHNVEMNCVLKKPMFLCGGAGPMLFPTSVIAVAPVATKFDCAMMVNDAWSTDSSRADDVM